MQNFKGLFMVVERDDAVLIPDDGIKHEDFMPVDVALDDGAYQ